MRMMTGLRAHRTAFTVLALPATGGVLLILFLSAPPIFARTCTGERLRPTTTCFVPYLPLILPHAGLPLPVRYYLRSG